MSAINIYLYLAPILLLCTIVPVYSETCHENGSNIYFQDPVTSGLELISAMTVFMKKSDQFSREAQPDVTPDNSSHYDFIVVGAGSSGAVVASRLSEAKEAKVLLIEAGDEEGLYMDIPMIPDNHDESLNWGYKTEPTDKYCLAMTNNQCRWPRGKVMGGTSVLNYMIATRGYKKDFDRWAEAGSVGWSYEDVLPYFKKLENIRFPELVNDTKYHATGGPMSISPVPYRTPLAKAFLDAGLELGMREVDVNGESFIGVSYIPTTIENGTRMSTNRAYLHSKFRKNLHVTKRSLVSKVLIDPSTKRAHGVQYTKDNVKYTIHADKEIVLSAGVIGSPQLLMLSGVGPKDHLREVGIEVIKDAPVGQNLQDHIYYSGLSFTVNESVSLLPAAIQRSDAPYLMNYLQRQTGPFGVPGTAEAFAFANANDIKNPDAIPNIEHLFFSTSISTIPTYQDSIGLRPELRQLIAPLGKQHSWNDVLVLVQPKSRGWLKLKSADINDHPIIVPNYLDHPDDMKALAAGIKQAIDLSKTKAMQKYNSSLFEIDLEPCKKYKDNPDEHVECYIRNLIVTTYHPCGTCKMGRKDDPTAVLDPELRVIDIDGLRVADTSAMPTITSAHPNIAACMMGEKLSDMLKQKWNYL